MSSFLMKFLAALLVCSGLLAELRAQSQDSAPPQKNVVVAKLFQPIYLAKQARITGDVELELKVKADGSLESATVVSGHPLLMQAALDSANHSLFECRSCTEGTRFHILYSFQLGPTMYCWGAADTSKAGQEQETYPKVAQERNRITLVDQPVGTCDPAVKIVERKVRSVKCLFLWKCGSSDGHEEPL